MVNAGSGNQQLNFKAWTPFGNVFDVIDANIHYQANVSDKNKKGEDGITRAQGILLSRSAEFFIDLAQLDRTPDNVLQHLLNGGSVPVKACMTFLPWKCVSANLTATVQ